MDDDQELLEQLRKISVSIRAENTRLSYERDWRLFCRWTVQANRESLPASDETVALYIAHEIARKRRLATVRCRISAIRWYHRAAGHSGPGPDSLKQIMRGAKRMLKEQPRCKAALLLDDLRRICAQTPGTPLEIRDRAIILFGFASAFRRAEIARMEYSDVQVFPKGMLIHLRWEKQDQEGRGRTIAVCRGKGPTCPVTALERWLDVRGHEPGVLFNRFTAGGMTAKGFTGEVITKLLQRELRRVGIDWKAYGAHSLRAGFITAAGLAGHSEMVISQHTGHKSMDILRRYFRPRDPFAAAISGKIGL